MRVVKRIFDFFLCLLVNMLIDWDGLIPAAVLLVLHYLFELSVWWAVAATVLWIVRIVIRMHFIGWARKCGDTPDIPKENKNPYSVGYKKTEKI